ncbi:hypothetical protein HID58_093352 [Brassica napus]|uniref:Uncharacterized protein n=1 Tax=Brassica napus TaxID=3708 RepID=A0ABQ7XBE1_BRANA|nr:hypothetical protein HID58_093352 [Brassica napus]
MEAIIRSKNTKSSTGHAYLRYQKLLRLITVTLGISQPPTNTSVTQCLSNHLHTFRDHLSEGSVYSLSSFDFTRSNNYFRLSDAHVSFRFNDVNDVKFTPQEFAELIAAMNVTINGKSGKHVTSFCAVGDAVIMQFVNGTGKHVGIRVDYSTAAWLNTERSNQFIVQAYIKGLDYIDLEASSCPLSQDRLLLPIDRSDKVTCTKLQSFIEELKQLIYFTTHMVIVVITKLTFQIVSTGDGGSSWRPRCHQRLSRLLLLQYHWLQFYCKRSLSFLLSKLIHLQEPWKLHLHIT